LNIPDSLEGYLDIKVDENPSIGSRVVPGGRKNYRTDRPMGGRTDGHTYTDTRATNLIVVVRNFANAPKGLLIFTQIFNYAHADGSAV
jgi:hypothetical protein